MKLSEFFHNLATTDLADSHFANSKEGKIVQRHIPAMITHTRYALDTLYTRFPLHEKEVAIRMIAGMSHYKLHSDYAEFNTGSEAYPKYIVDSPFEPFKDDILRIERVYDEVGNELPFNDDAICCAVKTVAYDTIQVINAVESNVLFAIYRASHEYIPSDANPDEVHLAVPQSHMEALSYYVASRAYGSMSSPVATNKGAEYLQKFENACDLIEKYNLSNNSESNTNTKPYYGGWI